jgi:hypothetical protein
MQLPTRGTLRHEHRLYFTTALRAAPEGGQLARLIRTFRVHAELILPMRTVKVTGIAILTVGTAAAFVAVKAGLSPHEHFKRTVAAVRKVHCGCTSFQIWAEKNAVDFSQNLRRGRMQKGMLPCGNIPFVAWLFNF